VLVLAGCTQPPESCPATTPIGLDRMAAITTDHALSFRFPLDASSADADLYHGWFGETSEGDGVPMVHAAEDYRRPAGTPVYAIADGRVSYSGRAGGYGWLVIVDHPQFNLYSLYGHLSPSRWRREPGPVSRGTLLGYLGDPDENGGSPQRPLDPHLHFGLRAGQRADYPKWGEWRWMAGWMRLCPQDLGWLQPSLVIATGAVPGEGFAAADGDFLALWGLEMLITLSYSVVGVGIFASAVLRRQRAFFLVPGILIILAGTVLLAREMLRTPALLAAGGTLFALGACRLVAPSARPEGSPPGGTRGAA
jgi:hypothetical protein